MRQLFIFLIALAALSGSIVAGWATLHERDEQLRGYVDPTQDADLPFRIPRLGVNAELTQYTEDELRTHFDLMQQAHITWVRQMTRWDEIEPQPGTFEWTAWDAIVSTIADYPELQLVAVLVNSPNWARAPEAPDVATAPPQNPDDFADFARAFAERYGQQVDFYQVWDEPNITLGWGNREPRPVEYLALLQPAYTAIHAADEGATVIAAALAPTTEVSPKNISDIVYLHDLYALGAKESFDAVAAKPYGFDTPPDDRRVDNAVLNFSRIVALREEMLRAGDGKTALWASNWGWNSLPDNWTGAPSIWGSVSANERTAFTLAALDRADREWVWLGGMILYHWQPDAPPDDPIWGFALIDQYDSPTPLWMALSQRQIETTAMDGIYAPTVPFARYSGVWTFGTLGADIGWLKDSQLEFDFNGRDVALLLRQDDYAAYLYPTVDGQPANTTPRDASGNAYIVLTSDTLEPEVSLVPVARNLPPGRHQLHVVADRGYDQWALVGYAISSGNLAEPYNRQAMLAVMTAVIAGVSAIVSAWFVEWGRLLRPLQIVWQRLADAGQVAVSAVTSIALFIGMLLTWGDATPNLFRREPVQLGLAIITAGVIYIQPALLLTLAAALAFFVMSYHRPELGLTLTLFYTPFFLFPVELYHFAFPMSELLMLLTAAAWALRILGTWGRARQTSVSQYPALSPLCRLNAVDIGVLAWMLLGVISLAWAAERRFALTELRTMMIEPVLFYVILRATPLDKSFLVRLVDALLLAGFLVALIGLWLFVRGEAIITAEEGARRLASVYGSPNNVGLFLGRCIPFALAYLLIPTDKIRRSAAGIILAVMLLAVGLSLSAGALFIGVPLAVIAVFLLAWGKRATLPLLMLVVIGILAFGVALQSPRFARILDFSEGTNFYRIRVWQSAVNIIHDHPITGIGLDQFLYAYRGQYIMPDAWQEPNLSHPHNVVLDFWVRLGILGVLVFLWIQAAFWKTARPLYRLFKTRDAVCYAIVVGMMGSMVNLIGHGLVDNSVYVQDLCYVFVLLLALPDRIRTYELLTEGVK